MKTKIDKKNIWAFFLLIFFSLQTFSKITFTDPKDGEWVSSFDDLKKFKLNGTTDLGEGTELKLSIGKNSWKTTVDKTGNFIALIDPYKIAPQSITEIKIEAFKNSKLSETTSLKLFCCSSEKYGYFRELRAHTAEDITITAPGNDIDGVNVKIPKGNLKKDAKVIVSVKRSIPDIPEEYLPLNSVISIDISHLITANGITYTITAQPEIPRESLGIKISVDEWNSHYNDVWKNIDMTKHKILVLAEKDFQWVEIVPTKISGNKIEFKLPKGEYFNLFVPVAVKSSSK